jgi:sorbitol-specific phosphotransferase system component IIA
MSAFKALRGVGVAASIGVAVLLATASGALAAPKCGVVNVGTNQSYSTLQAAVDGATSGDTLKVKGTCYGDTTVGNPNRERFFDLTIVGQGNATLNGDNNAQSPGSVLVLGGERIDLAITGLTITGGYGRPFTGGGLGSDVGGVGGGFEGSLTLNESTVSNNTGGGISCGFYISLTLNNSIVSDTTALAGGGIHDEDQCKGATLNNSTVSGNTARFGGGIYNHEAGVTLNNSTVSDNTAEEEGGGMYAGLYSEATLNNSTVSGNTAPRGGGICMCGFTAFLTLGGKSSVSRNTASGNGGGIYNLWSVTLNDSSSVSRNTASGNGGGIYNVPYAAGFSQSGSVTFNGESSVSRNTASGQGGGIFNLVSKGATISYGTGWSGAVSRNEPDNIFNF